MRPTLIEETYKINQKDERRKRKKEKYTWQMMIESTSETKNFSSGCQNKRRALFSSHKIEDRSPAKRVGDGGQRHMSWGYPIKSDRGMRQGGGGSDRSLEANRKVGYDKIAGREGPKFHNSKDRSRDQNNIRAHRAALDRVDYC